MSENEFIRHNSMHSNDEDGSIDPIIAVFEGQQVDQVKIEEKMKRIYAPIQYPTCGSYNHPDLKPIKQRKLEVGKNFIEVEQKGSNEEIAYYDGLYTFNALTDKNSDFLTREKIRMVRDLREEYYEQNGEFIVQKDLISDQLSKLANISFQNNACLQFFQKNAILSERNNQKKQTPFQIELYIAGLHFNKHALHNEEQKKFEQLRYLLKEWAQASINPSLPEIAKELAFLQRVRDQQSDLEEISKKIDLVQKKYQSQKNYLQHLIKEIIKLNQELKDIRKRNGMETVPWKIHIKQYAINKRPSYDVGVTPFEISEKVVGNNAQQIAREQERRQQIKKQTYFIKVYANGQDVGKSQNAQLQWPSFKVNFQQKFNILVYTAPATLKVQIIKSGFINHVIDTIYIPVPGMNSKSITATEKRHQSTSFYSNGNDIREQNRKKIKKEERTQTQAPAGVLLHRMEWKGQNVKMPIMATKTLEQDTACTVQTLQDQHQQSQYEKLFDALDPRMDHKFFKQKIDAAIKKQGNALLPFIDIQSARHLLLKMKCMRPDLQKVQIPLQEQEIRNRQDLQQIIQDQYKRVEDNKYYDRQTFNPLEGKFSGQPAVILRQIEEVLKKIGILKGMASGSGGGNTRYKITEEIINQYIFQQMESPIVIFFRNLFTQKRKLGPEHKQSIQGKSKIDELEVNLHVRSAKNVPIRESSFERIKNFQDQQNKFKHQQMMMNYNNNAGMLNQFEGYGQGFFRQQPNVNMHGNTFFNAFQNQGRPNQEVSYNHLDLDRVNGFIELRYKKNIKRTRCFQGPFPEWNQTLFFNYSMKHEETNIDKIIMGCQNTIKVFIFDMIEESKPTQAISEARVKKTKFYLGRIDIPLSFLAFVPSISGLYKIDRPLIGFGYGIRRSGLFDFQNQTEEQSKTQNPDIHTYVNLDLFTQPLVDNMIAYNSDRKFVPGIGQNPLILQRANDWLDQLNTKRYIRLWLNNLEGKSIFICRYLSDYICCPKLSNEGELGSMIERTARFVSLIPRKYNCKLLEGTEQFHMKCTEFLNVKMGQDHGILLCNYFNFIDKAQGRRDYESLLAICKAFPYGKCIFVLRRDKSTNNCEIWDPFKGQCYYIPAKQYETFCCFIRYQKQSQSDNKGKDVCPIVELSCLVSKDNVFFNTQEQIKPMSMDFNLSDDKKWKSFINERTLNELFEKGHIQTIQTPINEQFYPQYHKLQSSIEIELKQYIRQNLEKERMNHFKPYTFKTNDRITNIVYNRLMPLCQTFKVDHRVVGGQSKLYNQSSRTHFYEAVEKMQEQRDKIKTEIPHEKNLFGFTLNMTYTTNEEVLEKIKQTQIHLDESNDIEFVLAIRCFEYPCFLVSVWVFIGTIG